MITAAMVIFYIDDMDQALSFYKTALGLTATTESSGWSTFRVADTFEIALHTGAAPVDAQSPHPFDALTTTLVLSVDDLDGYCSRIVEHGGTLDRVLEPRDGIPVRMGLVRDPYGNGFQVNEYVG